MTRSRRSMIEFGAELAAGHRGEGSSPAEDDGGSPVRNTAGVTTTRGLVLAGTPIGNLSDASP
ncbi:MAG: hypothetical protein KIT69_13350, partial [Propionibacteriaceae bacterium]|nr:hypothetical protein [Propionibacteriaceae bacterium]